MKKIREKVVLRDDDLSYFSSPETLEHLYGSLWEKVPIHFAAIPKIYSYQIEAPQDIHQEKEYYSIAENGELVGYIRQKISEGKIKILQHGFTHRDYNKQYELERSGVEYLMKELTEGKRILEDTFQVTIDTIVAPHDRFSHDAIAAIEQIGYKYISRGFAPLPREISWQDSSRVRTCIKLYLYYLTHGRKLRYPEMVVLGNHTEIYNYRIEGQTKKSIDAVVENASGNGIIAITLHHRAFTVIQRELLHYLLDLAE